MQRTLGASSFNDDVYASSRGVGETNFCVEAQWACASAYNFNPALITAFLAGSQWALTKIVLQEDEKNAVIKRGVKPEQVEKVLCLMNEIRHNH